MKLHVSSFKFLNELIIFGKCDKRNSLIVYYYYYDKKLKKYTHNQNMSHIIN